MTLHRYLREWTADEVAECLSVSLETSGRLWELKTKAKNQTPLGGDPGEQPGTVETPEQRLGDFGDKMPRIWKHLTPEQQKEINDAAEKYFS